jgi:prepilin-type N-terminal cleavage/methylation domain-containing protein/prepilin-type processing-associated H-X9-DG protein
MPDGLKGRRAFTLIELLVTIAIIGVLAALATGVAVKVGESSKRTACLSNLRQWGSALQLYVADHNGFMPRRGQGVRMVAQFNRPEDWFNALPPYMGAKPLRQMMAEKSGPQPGERSVFVCPAAPKPQKGSNVFLSYGMNMSLSQWNQPMPENAFALSNPATLVFMADSPGGFASTIPSGTGYSVPGRHGGSACVVFCDGHAQSFKGRIPWLWERRD